MVFPGHDRSCSLCGVSSFVSFGVELMQFVDVGFDVDTNIVDVGVSADTDVVDVGVDVRVDDVVLNVVDVDDDDDNYDVVDAVVDVVVVYGNVFKVVFYVADVF